MSPSLHLSLVSIKLSIFISNTQIKTVVFEGFKSIINVFTSFNEQLILKRSLITQKSFFQTFLLWCISLDFSLDLKSFPYFQDLLSSCS